MASTYSEDSFDGSQPHRLPGSGFHDDVSLRPFHLEVLDYKSVYIPSTETASCASDQERKQLDDLLSKIAELLVKLNHEENIAQKQNIVIRLKENYDPSIDLFIKVYKDNQVLNNKKAHLKEYRKKSLTSKIKKDAHLDLAGMGSRKVSFFREKLDYLSDSQIGDVINKHEQKLYKHERKLRETYEAVGRYNSSLDTQKQVVVVEQRHAFALQQVTKDTNANREQLTAFGETIQQQKTEYTEQYTELLNEMKTAETDLAIKFNATGSQIQQLAIKYTEHDKKIDRLETLRLNEHTHTEIKVGEVKKQVDTKVKNLQSRHHDLEKDHNNVKNKVDHHKEILEGEQGRLKASNEKLQKVLEKTIERVRTLEEDLRNANRELDNVKKRCSQLEKKFVTLKDTQGSVCP